VPDRPTLPSPQKARRGLFPFAPLIAEEIRTGIDLGLGLDLKREHRTQNDGIARVIEYLVDIVCTIHGSRDKSGGLGKGSFRCRDRRFLRPDACVDGLPRIPERGVRSPLHEQELQPGVEAANGVRIHGIGNQ
jgi:hypothetical protein